ncbi:hypothetical protein SERLA73DRAFT_187358 [Serpula lacrymans var. lacrymans S7.3]|uniref:PPIase cyclophilin-type domain-containing protein n=2 Tax=Serpula lacrymans var. lacrymans TaxID=341189 RepID=F8Q911_SERL3|nr:uncharacterized protein SERLADRAFT_476850 [Serpula lacrymans var. lacrymans S7.9]EGN95066.1 hypothetical protein SERLA73DRAFT_187358 [Serpula lacrymans var. lacrymans S7.3]EGO20556.1 hypothetical protein SERLADRAFT_476850 [Serpula lacrymans var. lacrymans S7.9]
MALPTNGRVIIDTTVGEIDIELWSKETPKTCRNFLALAMEGYYDGVIFHRVVPGFLVQTGDKTGTGGGGESFYGEPFEDEIHPRLRFAHRGLIAMANNGTKNSNDSQFIITLDRADELHGKHTLFGRCMGDTIYNVMKIGDMELDENERPLYPPKINSITIVDNPFDDIVPRITAAERRAQQRAKETAQREREEADRRRGAKKNVNLLSFAEDEEDRGDEVPIKFKKKAIVRPDLLEDPQSTAIPEAVFPPMPSRRSKSEDSGNVVETGSKAQKSPQKGERSDITKIREKHALEQVAGSNSRKVEIEKMEAEIRKLSRKHGDDSDDEHTRKKTKNKSYLEEEMAKYSKGRGLYKKSKDGKKKDEGDVLAALNNFRGKLKSSLWNDIEHNGGDEEDTVEEQRQVDDEGMEIDVDRGFMGHALQFPKDDGEETRKAERDYEVIDPRQRNARAKEEERERKRATKAKGNRYRR